MPPKPPTRYHTTRRDQLALKIQTEWGNLATQYPDTKQLLHTRLDPGAIYHLAQLAAHALLTDPTITITIHKEPH